MDNKAKVKYNVEEYIKIMDSLGVKQMVLQGPPGTSKTYNAKQIIAYGIWENLKEKDKFSSYDIKKIKKLLYEYQMGKKGNTKAYWDMVQFHPSYGYEDFVRGITVTTENQQIKYKTINKVFGNICKLAKEDKEKNGKDAGKYFLLIDEINRADSATVFGELIYALEYRDEWVEVPYTLDREEVANYSSKILVPDNNKAVNKKEQKVDNPSKISVPDNLYIIATMNTADKSVCNIDYAIRRRFLFFDLLPDENVIRKNRLLNEEQDDDIVIKTFKGINKFIEDTTKDSQYRANDFKIGHTYFLNCNNDLKFHYKMQYQVLPILREYYIDGIIKEQENFDSFNKYLKGEDLDSDSLEEISDFLKEIIKEFEANSGELR